MKNGDVVEGNRAKAVIDPLTEMILRIDHEQLGVSVRQYPAKLIETIDQGEERLTSKPEDPSR